MSPGICKYGYIIIYHLRPLILCTSYFGEELHFQPVILLAMRSPVENLHSQLKLTGNFERQSKHTKAISLKIFSLIL